MAQALQVNAGSLVLLSENRYSTACKITIEHLQRGCRIYLRTLVMAGRIMERHFIAIDCSDQHQMSTFLFRNALLPANVRIHGGHEEFTAGHDFRKIRG